MNIVVLSATIDVKRNIFDLCTDTKDCYLAVIEVILVVIQSQLAFFFMVQYDGVMQLTSVFPRLPRRTKILSTTIQSVGCTKLADRDLQRKRRRMTRIRF